MRNFLGHPFIDVVRPTRTRGDSLEKFALDSHKKTVGLLPGSRMNEITSLLDEILLAAEKINEGDGRMPIPCFLCRYN